MSVMSKTFGYAESCGLSHEFLRRGCSYTPKEIKFVGDLIVINETITKQSLVDDFRGGKTDVEITIPAASEDCGEVTATLPPGCSVEDTPIRSGSKNSFEFLIPHSGASLDYWDIDIYESMNDCGLLMDGGDAYQNQSILGRAVSLCGTIDISGHNVDAYYLDNRKSDSEDVDKYCIFFIFSGLIRTVNLYYLAPDAETSAGLEQACIDCSVEFNEALAELEIAPSDIIKFGML